MKFVWHMPFMGMGHLITKIKRAWNGTWRKWNEKGKGWVGIHWTTAMLVCTTQDITRQPNLDDYVLLCSVDAKCSNKHWWCYRQEHKQAILKLRRKPQEQQPNKGCMELGYHAMTIVRVFLLLKYLPIPWLIFKISLSRFEAVLMFIPFQYTTKHCHRQPTVLASW